MFFLFIFWNFRFLKNAKDEKSNMLWKRRKTKMADFWREKIKKCKWWKKGGKSNMR
jgi:hypothetical protein